MRPFFMSHLVLHQSESDRRNISESERDRGIPGTFWAEKDAYTENERWDEGGTKLKSPGRNNSNILDNNVGAESCTSISVSAPKLITYHMIAYPGRCR